MQLSLMMLKTNAKADLFALLSDDMLAIQQELVSRVRIYIDHTDTDEEADAEIAAEYQDRLLSIMRNAGITGTSPADMAKLTAYLLTHPSENEGLTEIVKKKLGTMSTAQREILKKRFEGNMYALQMLDRLCAETEANDDEADIIDCSKVDVDASKLGKLYVIHTKTMGEPTQHGSHYGLIELYISGFQQKQPIGRYVGKQHMSGIDVLTYVERWFSAESPADLQKDMHIKRRSEDGKEKAD